MALCFVAVAVSFASNPEMGTWKLNEAKSKLAPGATKNNTVVYEAVGDKVKVTVDGIAGDSTPRHSEWIGKFDGKDYPVTGDPGNDARAYKKINDHTLELTNKKGGKVVSSGTAVVSADGKTRTVSLSSVSANGTTVKNTAVYEKQ